jgi:hypothetical protein
MKHSYLYINIPINEDQLSYHASLPEMLLAQVKQSTRKVDDGSTYATDMLCVMRLCSKPN